MAITEYHWNAADQFIGRAEDLARLDAWWSKASAEPINLFGRRRVGKSWLFRKFAHGKPAVVLVAEQTTPAQQLSKLADQLTPHLPFRPDITEIGQLFAVLHQLADRQKVLVVVDEFPYLLGSSPTEIQNALSSVQATMERLRDDSRIKLILCGSAVTQMEDLQSERSPLHGRLQRFALAPLEFAEAKGFMPGLDPLEQLTRFSISGGMPRYLAAVSTGPLASVLAREVIDRNAPLFNEPLALLQAEVREPAVYLAILAALASKPADSALLSDRTGMDGRLLGYYLDKLEIMGLVRKRRPVGADQKARSTQYQSNDDFLRFWFRFVHPYQADLEAGSDAASHVKHHVMPALSEHSASTFEDLTRRWLRQEYPEAAKVGAWWGPALNTERRAKRRFTEEVDAVGLKGKTCAVVGEAKWTHKVIPLDVLTDLLQYKIPALEQAGYKPSADLRIVLAGKTGFSAGLHQAAAGDTRVNLVTAATILTQVR